MEENKLYKNTILNIIKTCSTVIFPLITFPYISRVLQAENIGKINFADSYVRYYVLVASLGITPYAVRVCSNVKKDKDELGRVSSELYSINICMLLSTFIVFTLITLNVKSLNPYIVLAFIYSLNIFFSILGTDWINTALEDYMYITLRTFAFQLLSLILVVIFVRKPEDYIKFAIITVISSSGANVSNMIYRRRFCSIKFTLKMRLKEHMPHIGLLFSMMISQYIFNSSDITILGLMKGDYEVGLYSTSVKIYNVMNALITSLNWVAMPQLTRLFTDKNYKEIGSTLSYSLEFMATLGFPCVVGMIFLSPEIVYFIAGSGYVGAEGSLQLMGLVLFLAILWGLLMNFVMLPDGKEIDTLISCSVAAVLNIILNLIFIPRFGATGAAATTVISYFVGFAICFIRYEKKVKIDDVKGILTRTTIGSFIVALVCMLTKIVCSNQIIVLVVSVVISIIIYLPIEILLGNKVVIKYLNKIVKRTRR